MKKLMAMVAMALVCTASASGTPRIIPPEIKTHALKATPFYESHDRGRTFVPDRSYSLKRGEETLVFAAHGGYCEIGEEGPTFVPCRLLAPPPGGWVIGRTVRPVPCWGRECGD